AEISSMDLDYSLKRAVVYVKPDQQSLAIGKRGQNVRLASKLSKWDLDIVTVSDADIEKLRKEAPDVGSAPSPSPPPGTGAGSGTPGPETSPLVPPKGTEGALPAGAPPLDRSSPGEEKDPGAARESGLESNEVSNEVSGGNDGLESDVETGLGRDPEALE